jgi:hypothetical protein
MNKLRKYASSLTIGIPLAYGLAHTATGCQTVVGLCKGAARDFNALVEYAKEPLYSKSAKKDSIQEGYDAMEKEIQAVEAERKQKESELEETAQEE